MEIQGQELVISFYGQDFTKTNELTLLPPFTELDWFSWPQPGILIVSRFMDQEVTGITESFIVDIKNGTMEEGGQAIQTMKPIPGTELLESLGLFDSQGHPIGSNIERIPQEDSAHMVYKVSGGEIFSDRNSLMYRPDGGTVQVLATDDSVRYPDYRQYYKYNTYQDIYPGVNFSAVPIVITQYQSAKN